jgi:hypothetical protein
MKQAPAATRPVTGLVSFHAPTGLVASPLRTRHVCELLPGMPEHQMITLQAMAPIIAP